MEITPVDLTDEAALRAWHATYLAAETHDAALPTPWMFEELSARFRAAAVDKEFVVLAGRRDGRVLATGVAELPLKDNLDRAGLLVHTHPDALRRGNGTAMLRELEVTVAARGRSLLGSEVSYPYELGPTGAGAAGVEFLLRHGYQLALGDIQRSLSLPVDPALLSALATEAAAHHAAYRLRVFADRCPDDLVESYGRLVGLLTTEAPMGDLALEPEVYDAERVRHEESVARASGRTSYVAVAQDARDEVVAYTQLMVAHHDPGRVYQWGTLVHPAHRGHRLGLAVKTAAHALLQEREPDLTLCVTTNAEVNGPMVAINERLGYRPVGRLAEFEKALG